MFTFVKLNILAFFLDCCFLVIKSCLTLCDPVGSLPCPLLSPGVCSNSRPLSWWSYLTISFSGSLFPSHLQSFPASGAFLMSQLFASGGQGIGVSVSASVLPINTQNWFPLGWTGRISLLSKGLPRVFSNTTVQKHPFSGTQFSL